MPSSDTASHRVSPGEDATLTDSSNDPRFSDAPAAQPPQPVFGWDPYEVWRSRVLVPSSAEPGKRR
jgi:hypothetical protein